MMNFETPSVKVFNKSCHDMSELADNSVQMCVTSPPYWNLRKYSGEQDLIWGNHNGCVHEWGREQFKVASGGNASLKVHTHGTDNFQQFTASQGQYCQKCGAWRGAFGLEPTVELYIQHSIEILREIKRVLRPDGVVFWNLSDSYAGSGGTGNQFGQIERGLDVVKPSRPLGNLKPKDLCLIPERFAIAAQADGWWVRSRIAWVKPNPMPESCKDRPTDSWEHIWMLTKSARYFWDQDAVKETQADDYETYLKKRGSNNKYQESGLGANHLAFDTYNPAGRNLRSAWTFPTHGYSGAHFAVYPEKLPEICIKAATSEAGCCAECGSPWVRVVDISRTYESGSGKSGNKPQGKNNGSQFAGDLEDDLRAGPCVHSKTLGWKPSCKCQTDKPPAPCVVLDPFAGSCTTLAVAQHLGRWSIGYEISADYCELGKARIEKSQPPLPLV